MKILIISCSLNPDSRSAIMAKCALAGFESAGAAVDSVDLRELDMPPCDGAKAYSHPHVQQIKEMITQASAILLAVPIYNFDVNAAAKNLIELTGKAWSEKIVGFLCAAGGQSSYMSVMSLAASLMLDFRCLIVPRYVYTTGSAFNGDQLVDQDVADRINQLCHQTLRLTTALAASPSTS